MRSRILILIVKPKNNLKYVNADDEKKTHRDFITFNEVHRISTFHVIFNRHNLVSNKKKHRIEIGIVIHLLGSNLFL